VGEAAVVYDRAGYAQPISTTPATISWKSCDGSRSVGDIVAILAREYPESAGQIASDVQAGIDTLVREHALVFVDLEPPRPVSRARRANRAGMIEAG
jgi:hypothetical protein